jgi:para-nitrobenzyl esterase
MSPIVETASGRLEGFEDAGLETFLGIPFAAPPVGPNRFRAPAPPEPWSGVRDATQYGPSAPQAALELGATMPGFDVGRQAEDCLYLNVFTPCTDAGRRPVMVWIHGGAFTLGSGSQKMYDLRPLARAGVVAVTINYRLGALGYLHLSDLDPQLDTSACAGVLDQLAALEWVRDNIAAFGGDPECVTIFGESAGGMSVGTLLGAPRARGLFHRAIPQSGAAHAAIGTETATRVAEAFLGELGTSRDSLGECWDAPVEAVLAAQQRTADRLPMPLRLRAFRPVVDGQTLPDPPIDAIRSGLSADVPVVVGACRDEERLFTLWDPVARELDDAGVAKRMDERQPGHGARLVEAYRGARGDELSSYDLYCAIETDRVFRIPAVRLAEAQAMHQECTFSYLVTWEAQAMDGQLGACHGVDLPFALGMVGSKAAGIFAGSGPEAERLQEEMKNAWLDFARSGDPNHDALCAWPRHEEARRATMFFGRDTHVEDAPFEAERRAWEGVL